MTDEFTDIQLKQLARIKYRLETYPFGNAEIRCLSDCIIGIINTLVGAELPKTAILDTSSQGNTTGIPEGGMLVGNQVLSGGREIAPGVIEYYPNNVAPTQPNELAAAPIDINAGQAAFEGKIAAVPGSIADTAQGIPNPNETKVKIISSENKPPSGNNESGSFWKEAEKELKEI